MRHKWDENNKCVNCGVVRQKKSWKLLMAIEGSRDYYKYGTGYYYGISNKDNPDLIKGIGFKRPECKKQPHEQ